MTIDLRSDTVTMPSLAMRQAMAAAAVGDDVYGEDPTVNHLEALAAEMAGKPAAMFVPSGTMGNLIALLVHCRRGQEAIAGDESHVYNYEAGGASALGGIPYHPVPTAANGTLALADIGAAIRADDPHQAPAGVICLENTHNRCGGRVLSPAYFADVAALAARHDLPVHLDGARIFNAAVARGLPAQAWCERVTSVQFCLSKGLAAPAGSILAGPAEFVRQARRLRKMLGGGMRQAGILAAAGIIALTGMVDRLAEDHANARLLAEGLANLPGIVLDPATVETNVIVFRLAEGRDPAALTAALKAEGVLVSGFGQDRLRAVTHFGISDEDCRTALDVIARVWATVSTGRAV